jgi:hypothetical protein
LTKPIGSSTMPKTSTIDVVLTELDLGALYG